VNLVLSLIFVLFFFLVPSAQATELGDAAAALSPGQWTKITTANIAVPSGAFGTLTYQVATPGYDGNVAAWNSHKRQWMMESTSDPSRICNTNIPITIYDDAKNAWSTGAAPPGCGFHGYDGVAWDDANEVLYYRPGNYGTPNIYRYCVNNTPSWCSGKAGTWSTLPNAIATGGCYQIAVGITYHATMDGGSLLCYDGERGMVQFRESTGTWTGIIPGTFVGGVGPYNTCMEYSPAKQVSIFGCGGTGIVYKISDTKVVTQLTSAPSALNFGVVNHDMIVEPVTGNFLVIIGYAAAQGRLYLFNPDGAGTWTLLDNNLNTSGKICETYFDASAGCSGDFYGASVSTYGVAMYWKYKSPTDGEVWIYKYAASGGDTTAPTVSITAPSASTVSGTITISATASDNVGVSGVQFKLNTTTDIGSEDTSAPYSISWDSTTVTNGLYSLTATARDAAGNLGVSAAVAITVSNIPGGNSDFTTRCAAAGVLRCIGFDSASDIANTQWGANTGIDTAGDSVPVLDTTQKASGASSIKFTIPANSGANSSGEYWANFSTDLLTQFGENSTFYVQWRQRFSSCFVKQGSAEPCTGAPRVYALLAGSGGWKQVLIGTGDKPGCTTSTTTNCASSCTDLEIGVQNTNQRGYTQMYNSCNGSDSHGKAAGFEEPFGGSDFKMENAMVSPYCLYTATNAGTQFPPTGNCFPYYTDEWLTFKVKVTTGAWAASVKGGPVGEFKNSHVDMWVARDGQPSVQAFNWGPYNLTGGETATNQKFGKIHLLPYHTYKDPAQTNPVAYTWYDELIISTQDIADPSTSAAPQAPSGFKIK